MLWDRDGTVAVFYDRNAGLVPTFTEGQRQTLNDEDTTTQLEFTVNSPGRDLVLIFPELRDITGLSIYVTFGSFQGSGSADWSANSTNGVDGTWNQIEASWAGPIGQQANKPEMRDDIYATALSGVKALRFRITAAEFGFKSQLRSLHVYGNLAAGESPDRLRVWHPTLDEALDDADADGPFFDFGDHARLDTATKTFRVKNISGTLTATSITVSLNVLTDASPALSTWMELSTDDVNYSTSLNISSLAPGSISSVIFVRAAAPDDAQLSLWWPRITAVAGTYS